MFFKKRNKILELQERISVLSTENRELRRLGQITTEVVNDLKINAEKAIAFEKYEANNKRYFNIAFSLKGESRFPFYGEELILAKTIPHGSDFLIELENRISGSCEIRHITEFETFKDYQEFMKGLK